ncbi:MAG: hypothetical protein JWP12_1193 [Bacteroidetes bacterium]|nr:hypothetical protein [Bacteroidota bacterium]
MKELKFTLTLDETNLILKSLGRMPYGEVFGLVSKIQQQANSQLMNSEKLAAGTENENHQ